MLSTEERVSWLVWGAYAYEKATRWGYLPVGKAFVSRCICLALLMESVASGPKKWAFDILYEHSQSLYTEIREAVGPRGYYGEKRLPRSNESRAHIRALTLVKAVIDDALAEAKAECLKEDVRGSP